MDAGDLLKDELEYELACRGVYNILTVMPMRKILREMLSLEKRGESSIQLSAPAFCTGKSQSEINICQEKIITLSQTVNDMLDTPDDAMLKRIISRLLHLKNRATLIEPTCLGERDRREKLSNDIESLFGIISSFETGNQDDEGILSEKEKEILHQSLGHEAVNLIANLELQENGSKLTQEPAGSLASEALHRDQQIAKQNHEVGLSGPARVAAGVQTKIDPLAPYQFQDESKDLEDEKEVDLQPLQRRSLVGGHKFGRCSTVEKEITNRKLFPIKDWGVKFSGNGSVSINAFLERVEELIDARNAEKEDLWRYAIDFFEGDALIWFRANKDYVRDWDGLKQLLLLTFQRPYYQDELLQEIKARTQGKAENVTIYVSIMQNMFKRLPEGLEEHQKIAILLKNVQPYYQQAVCRDKFASVAELVAVLRIIERTKTNCDAFREPNTSVNAIEPDLAYKGHSSHEIYAVSHRSLFKQGERTFSSTNTGMKCWNCRASGHGFRNCKLPAQRLFCYKCGKFGQTTNNCPCSSKAGNGKVEDVNTAERLPKA